MTAMLMLLAPIKHLDRAQSAHPARPRGRRERVRPDGHAGRGGPRPLAIGRARGEVTFEDVSFTYPTRVEPALAGIDLAIRPGETLALVGPSGGGKTTLVNLLPRFYRRAPGASCSTATTSQALTLESLRANIALVSQEIVLFNDTIYANIAYGAHERTRRRRTSSPPPRPRMRMELHPRDCREGFDTLIGENGAAPLRRPAPAPGDRARAAQERADADPGRGDLGARLRIGAPGAGRAGRR